MASSNATTKRDFSLADIGGGTALMLAVISVNKLGLAGNIIFFLVLSLMATRSVKLAFEALVLGVLALCTNQAIVLKTAIWAFSRFLLLLGLSGRFLFIDQARTGYALLRESRYITLCLFCFVASLTSLAANNRPDIALLKVLLFWLSLSGMWSAVSVLRAGCTDVAPWMIKIITATCVLNLISLPLGIANNFRAEGFSHGLYNLGFYHSQTVGPACAMMIVYLVSVWLFTAYRNRWICGPLVIVLLYSIFLSGSRTGAITVAGGLATLITLALAWRGNQWVRIRINMQRSTLVATTIAFAGLVIVGDIVAGGTISRRATAFITKGRKDPTAEALTIETAFSSRQALIDRSMMYFWQSPLIGNGFQMYGDREATQNTTIMTSQVEKGFLPAAILEETGILGTAFFLLFVATCIGHYVYDRNIPGLAAFAALLAMNLGECSFFSFAGHGGLMWCFVAASDLLGFETKVAFQPGLSFPQCQKSHRAFGRAAAAL